MPKYHPVVEELVGLIHVNHWEEAFNEAIRRAQQARIPDLADIRSLDDYLGWINDLLYWVPSENHAGREVYNHLCKFHFILDQPPVLGLQNRIVPHPEAPPLTELSAWMVRYANAMGQFLDTPESLTPASLQSFYDSPTYNMNDYIVPHGGWKTFNQFFARDFKPGYRPVAAVSDPSVIVSPADSTFAGQWEIRTDSHVTVKNLHWSIGELMEGSPYKDRFVNGLFMHAFLGPNDYHRQHAPVGGTVLEARVVPGQVYLEVVAEPIAGDPDGRHRLKPVRTFDAPDNAGYQFAQARGLVVLDTPIGLVAVLPIGMCQVSSVILTAEVGVTLRKGEEISYFQFGGSDIIVLFEAKSNVSFTAQPNVHYKMGTRIAQAFPVI
ncbi:MAG TPA: phosphatidylserine decarboxylase [Acidobacteria bacterium]|nr:phosphatidylserine decarboxylase [Acidobacteriota bacterium]